MTSEDVKKVEDTIGKIPIAKQWVGLAQMTGTGLSNIVKLVGNETHKRGDKMRRAMAETLKPIGFTANQIGWMTNTALPDRDALGNPLFVNNMMNDMVYKALSTFPNQFTTQQLNYLKQIAQGTVNKDKPFKPAPFLNYKPVDAIIKPSYEPSSSVANTMSSPVAPIVMSSPVEKPKQSTPSQPTVKQITRDSSVADDLGVIWNNLKSIF